MILYEWNTYFLNWPYQFSPCLESDTVNLFDFIYFVSCNGWDGAQEGRK